MSSVENQFVETVDFADSLAAPENFEKDLFWDRQIEQLLQHCLASSPANNERFLTSVGYDSENIDQNCVHQFRSA